MVLRIGHIHERNARKWMNGFIDVYRHNGEIDEWESVWGMVPASVQVPRSQSSSQDEDVAGPEELEQVDVFTPLNIKILVGDRIEWDGDVWVVNSVEDRRSDRSYHKCRATKHQMAVVKHAITFRRVVTNADSVIVGTRVVGTYEVQFTRGAASRNTSLQPDEMAAGGSVDGYIVAPLDASDLSVGDMFDRDGMPGRIVSIDRSAPDHIELRYTMEVAVV